MSDHWEPCPRCKSNDVKTTGKGFWFLLLLGSGSILFWIGLIIWPLLVVSIAFIILSPFSFLMPKVNQCSECKKSWLVKKNKKKDEASA